MPRFAAVQMKSELRDPETNLKRVIDRFHEAAANKAKVVLFPECVLTGYALSLEEAGSFAESIPGPRTDRMTKACVDFDALSVFGTIEKDEVGNLFNTAVLVGPTGVLGRYRKTHLPCLGVDRYLTSGEELTEPVETKFGSIGLLICYDLRFPEPTRVLALAGAQVLLLPTAWPDRATIYPDFINRSRSEENHIYILAANHVGEENGIRYLGRSLITSPQGEILSEASTDQEEILYADVDLARSDQKQIVVSQGEYELDLFADRRPELYGRLTEMAGKP